MNYVRFGNTGIQLSELCLGTWMFGTQRGGREVVDRTQAHQVLDAAWERGINFIDTANVYGSGRSESYIGEWLTDKEREDFVLASKVFFATRGRQEAGLSRKIILAEADATLDRLNTDYVDIYYIHGWHEAFSLMEALSALNDLVRAGKVHYIGVSNFTAWQLVKSQWICDARGWEAVSVIQPRFNAADHVPYTVDPGELPLPDLFDACRDLGIAVCPYSPLAEGFLTGKYRRGADGQATIPEDSRAESSERMGPFPDRWWRVLDAVEEVAEELGAVASQVALRWTMMIEGLTSIPILGGRSVSQLEENLGALDLSLTPQQNERIRTAGAPDESSPYSYTA